MNEFTSPLAALASKGRYGDTMLAHINPEEAQLLRDHGGSGSINPETGLPEYFSLKKIGKKLKKIGKIAVAPIVKPTQATINLARGKPGKALGNLKSLARSTGEGMNMAAPYVGLIPGVGPVIGAGIGAGGAALTGKNILKGGLVGGLSGYAGSKFLGGQGLPGLFNSGTGALNGVFSSSGGLGSLLGNSTGGAGVLGDLSFGLPESGFLGGAGGGVGSSSFLGGSGLGSALSGSGGVGGSLFEGLGNIIGGGGYSDIIGQLGGALGGSSGSSGGLGSITKLLGNVLGGSNGTTGGSSGGYDLSTLLASGGLGALLGSQLGGGTPSYVTQKDVQTAGQKELFNRSPQPLNFNQLRNDASMSGRGLTDYVSQNWDKFSQGAYNNSTPTQLAKTTSQNMTAQPGVLPANEKPAFARGGDVAISGLSALGAPSASAAYAEGGGSGRDDTIDAKLSDGEFVVDAESVAMLGDGSNKEGARRLDEMRKNLRAHKGKALAKGKFSPNAKSPLAYIKANMK